MKVLSCTITKLMIILFCFTIITACGGGGGGGGGSTATTNTSPATKYVDVDFNKAVSENNAYPSDITEFIQLCDSCN